VGNAQVGAAGATFPDRFATAALLSRYSIEKNLAEMSISAHERAARQMRRKKSAK
jgi:hypothetical protein